ncbi:MAG: hypothetical protein IJB70_07425 [Clostridia bacterium]|nr:hypothetical protein [Clostridia bacterium]
MYKETAKSGINPFVSVLIWVVSLYVFYILWGIAEILFEFTFPIGKYVIILLSTIIFGWFLVTKVIAEYEFEVAGGKLSVTKIQSKRKKIPVALVAMPNIVSVCEGKKLSEKYKGAKIYSFTRPLQKGQTVYVIFKDEKEFVALKLKGSKKLVSVLKKRGSE